MNARELHRDLVEYFGKGNVHVDFFADPLRQLSHPQFNVQFVDDKGLILGPMLTNPDAILFAQPFAGPFYDLNVEGLLPHVAATGQAIVLRAVVRMPDGTLADSSPILVHTGYEKAKDVAAHLGIKWYYADLSRFPRDFIEMPSLDECAKYELVSRDSEPPQDGLQSL